MPQSLAKIYVHLVFSTRNRERTIPQHLGKNLHSYMGGIIRDLGGLPVEINSQPDHAHLLFLISRTCTFSESVSQIKTGSTGWLQEQSPALRNFHWQSGYGAFSVSESRVEETREYIRRQEEHHRVMTFQEEFRKFLEKHRVAYDEKYVWD